MLDVSSGRPVILVSKREENLGNLVDAAVGPGGDKLVTASGAPYEFDQWNLSTATQDGVVYPGSPYPNSVAISPVRRGLARRARAGAAAGLQRGRGRRGQPDLQPGHRRRRRQLPLPQRPESARCALFAPRAKVIKKIADLVFAVTGVALDGSAPTVTLNVLPGPSLP